jgi:predicted GH43/DUF377 family glycosyl hydrolase
MPGGADSSFPGSRHESYLPNSKIPVVRSQVRLLPDPKRVISRPFLPGGEGFPDGRSRVERILGRVLELSDEEVGSSLREVYERFNERHLDFASVLERQFGAVARHVGDPEGLSKERRQLVGAFFTHEYAVDAAALTNPSLVQAPHQEGVPAGSQRVILSLRAIGEGHLSSIQFRSGIIDASGRIELDPASKFARTAMHRHPTYDKATFSAKLSEMGAYTETAQEVVESLNERFTIEGLETRIREVEEAHGAEHGKLQALRTIHWLASSNYESTFHGDSQPSERIIFPAGPTESQGMEDARFVRFTYDDGSVTYFAPYTAYDGYRILPQLIETRDFMTFRMTTLNGSAAVNKGIAIFPRQVNGSFMALARLDNENNYLIRSNNVRFWHDAQLIQTPRAPWELVQLGNCGSPIETEAGWLVITHGVGPMRCYSLGAILLDLHDPSRVIGWLKEPLLTPAEDERDGYVPNVVYSCGSLRFGGLLALPFGVSDVGARIATASIDDILAALSPC